MFVAVWPDGPTVDRLLALPLEPVEALGLVRPGNWHVTLRFLGDVASDLVPGLVAALGSAAGSLPDSIPCRIGPWTAWFAGDRVLQVPVSGLDGAAAAVHAATAPVAPDTVRGGQRFTGHLTLARAGRRLTVPDRSALSGIPCASSFAVDALDLVVSRGAAGGVRYTTLARVPLGD